MQHSLFPNLKGYDLEKKIHIIDDQVLVILAPVKRSANFLYFTFHNFHIFSNLFWAKTPNLVEEPLKITN